MTPEPPILVVKRLVLQRGGNVIASPVNLRIASGAVVWLKQAQASGKTTLLRTIAGLESVHEGRIILNQRDVTLLSVARRAGSGLNSVTDDRQVYTTLTTEENLRLGQRCGNRPGSSAALAYDYFPFLYPRRQVPAGRLSGGEQQALVLARGLLSPARLILFDEPSEGLSAKTQQMLARWITDRSQADRVSFIIAEHASGVVRYLPSYQLLTMTEFSS